MSERIWSMIGKVSIIVAVLVGGVTLWEKGIAPRERLTAELRTSSFKVPKQILEEIASEVDAEQRSLVADLNLAKLGEQEKAISDDLKELLADPQYLSKRVIEIPGRESPPLSSAFELDVFDPSTLAELVIRNTGTKKLEDVTLSVGEWHYAHLVPAAGDDQWFTTDLGRESPPIKIGALSPGATARIELWGKSRWRSGDIQLSHANGLGEITDQTGQ